ACNAEGLARKAGKQHVVIRDVLCLDTRDISLKDMAFFVREVCEIRLLGELVPLTRENTPSAVTLKGVADATDACEQVDKGERAIVIGGGNDQGKEPLPDGVFPVRRN